MAPDSICIDVGASLGISSLALSVIAPEGAIYAFEPAPESFEYLGKNLTANCVPNVKRFQMALDNVSGKATFHVVPYFTAGSFTTDADSFLDSKSLGSISLKVSCTTLDEFLEQHPLSGINLISVDVEGSEIAVLQGGVESLAKYRPRVLLKFNSFALGIHRNLLAQHALSLLGGIFPHLFVLDRQSGSPRRLSKQNYYDFAYDNGLRGPVDHLLGSFADIRSARPYQRLP